jgi:hypothetical protein
MKTSLKYNLPYNSTPTNGKTGTICFLSFAREFNHLHGIKIIMVYNMFKDTCLNGLNDHEEISPIDGLVTVMLNSLRQRLGREATGMRMPRIFLILDFI